MSSMHSLGMACKQFLPFPLRVPAYAGETYKGSWALALHCSYWIFLMVDSALSWSNHQMAAGVSCHMASDVPCS